MTAKMRAQRDAAFRGAMSELVRDSRFANFIDTIRDWKEVAVNDACTDAVINSQRASMAAIGEIRAYKTILAIYDEYVGQLAEEASGDGEIPAE